MRGDRSYGDEEHCNLVVTKGKRQTREDYASCNKATSQVVKNGKRRLTPIICRA
jgi:hypothetical protein